MCPGGDTSNNNCGDTVNESRESTTDDTTRDIGDFNCKNSGKDTGGDSGNDIDGETGSNTCNDTVISTNSETFNVTSNNKGRDIDGNSCYVTGNSPVCSIGGSVDSGSGNNTGGDETTNSAIMVALVTKQKKLLARLIERSLATTLATSLALSLAVKKTRESFASAVTRLHTFKLTTKELINRHNTIVVCDILLFIRLTTLPSLAGSAFTRRKEYRRWRGFQIVNSVLNAASVGQKLNILRSPGQLSIVGALGGAHASLK